MKKNFFKGTVLATIMAFAGVSASAQDNGTLGGVQLSGSVDAYFRANATSVNELGEEPGTSFANDNGFALGMANLIAYKEFGKTAVVADLAFGPRADDATTGDRYVNQLYVTYAPLEELTFTFGKFNTFLGYEVISPVGNFNYSTSYMFSNGPFSHTGLKADYAIDENFSVGAAIMNATDVTANNNGIGHYTGGLQLGYANDKGSVFLNALYGKESADAIPSYQVDLTTGWDLTDELYLGANATYKDYEGSNHNGFYGVALYPQYDFTDAFSLGLRGEYFGNVIANTDTNVIATTLTGAYTVGGLTIKPELRLDIRENDDFQDLNGEPTEFLGSAVLGAVYAF